MSKKSKNSINRRKKLHLVIELLGVIAIWRGLWGISDLMFFPDNKLISYLFSIVSGLVLIILDDKISSDFK